MVRAHTPTKQKVPSHDLTDLQSPQSIEAYLGSIRNGSSTPSYVAFAHRSQLTHLTPTHTPMHPIGHLSLDPSTQLLYCSPVQYWRCSAERVCLYQCGFSSGGRQGLVLLHGAVASHALARSPGARSFSLSLALIWSPSSAQSCSPSLYASVAFLFQEASSGVCVCAHCAVAATFLPSPRGAYFEVCGWPVAPVEYGGLLRVSHRLFSIHPSYRETLAPANPT